MRRAELSWLRSCRKSTILSDIPFRESNPFWYVIFWWFINFNLIINQYLRPLRKLICHIQVAKPKYNFMQANAKVTIHISMGHCSDVKLMASINEQHLGSWPLRPTFHQSTPISTCLKANRDTWDWRVERTISMRPNQEALLLNRQERCENHEKKHSSHLLTGRVTCGDMCPCLCRAASRSKPSNKAGSRTADTWRFQTN